MFSPTIPFSKLSIPFNKKLSSDVKKEKQNLFLKCYWNLSEASIQLQQERQPYDIRNRFFLHPKQICNTFLRVLLKW